MNQAILESTVLNFILVQTGTVTLTGRVLDRDNQPLDSQSVGIAPSGTNNYTFTTTDSSGNYSFSTSPGDYKIRVSGNNPLIASAPPSYSITSSGTLSLTVDTTMDIPIPAKRVTVIVQDVAGQAIQNVTISTNSISMPNIPIGIVTNATGTSSYSSSLGLTTDSSGSATLWLFQTPNSGNRYTITATPPVGSNFVAKSLSPVAVPGDTNLLITMVRPLTFSGQVLDGLGNPLPGQIVSIAPPGTGNYTDSITDANGYYNFSVTSGEYIIKVQGDNEINTDAPANYSIQSSEVLLLADDTVMDIPLPVKRVSIHIQNEINDPIQDVELVTNDLPMPNIPIGTISNATGVSSYNALDGLISDSSGNATMWLFSTPPSGNRYTISATPPEGGIYNPFSLSGIEVTANQTEIIALQYNHEQPITTATLSPAPNSNGDYLNSATVTLSATAAEGHTIANTYYKVDGGTQQTYSAPFEVTGDGLHTVNYWSVDDSGVVEVQKTASFNIVNTHSLSGTVYLDANENGFQDVGEDGYEGALITLDSQDSDTTDANGNYSFADLETGVYEVALTIPSEYIATTTNPATISLNDNTTQNFGIAPEVTATPTPTVTPTPAEFTPVADTYIKQGSQNENEGSSTFIRLQSSGHNRGLVSFDESAIEAYIGQSQNYTAKLQFTITDNGNNWGNDGRTIDVHRALNGWVEGNGFIVGNSPSDRGTGSGVTWNCSVDTETSNQNDDCGGTTAWDMTNSSNWPFISTPTATATINSNQTGVVEFDVTSDVASFVAGTNQNYGWVIKKTNEGQNGRVEFGSKESSYAPKLIITLN